MPNHKKVRERNREQQARKHHEYEMFTWPWITLSDKHLLDKADDGKLLCLKKQNLAQTIVEFVLGETPLQAFYVNRLQSEFVCVIRKEGREYASKKEVYHIVRNVLCRVYQDAVVAAMMIQHRMNKADPLLCETDQLGAFAVLPVDILHVIVESLQKDYVALDRIYNMRSYHFKPAPKPDQSAARNFSLPPPDWSLSSVRPRRQLYYPIHFALRP